MQKLNVGSQVKNSLDILFNCAEFSEFSPDFQIFDTKLANTENRSNFILNILKIFPICFQNENEHKKVFDDFLKQHGSLLASIFQKSTKSDPIRFKRQFDAEKASIKLKKATLAVQKSSANSFLGINATAHSINDFSGNNAAEFSNVYAKANENMLKSTILVEKLYNFIQCIFSDTKLWNMNQNILIDFLDVLETLLVILKRLMQLVMPSKLSFID